MNIIKTATAGTMESSDIMVTIEPGQNGIEIELKSSVEKQFGRVIRQVITETLTGLGIAAARVTAVDKGALDVAVRARVKAAAYRACGEQSYTWGGQAR